MNNTKTGLITLIAAILTVQSAQAISPITTQPSVPFFAGEAFYYTLRWGMVTAGHSSLSIESIEDVQSKPAYHLVSEARSTGMVDSIYKVRDRNEAWLDTQTQNTLRYAKSVREGKYAIEETVELDQERLRFYQKSKRLDKVKEVSREGDIPFGVKDAFGSLYYVRTLPLVVGETYTIDVHSGNKTWPLSVRVLRREKIKVKAGRFSCIVVEPELREPGIFISKGKKLQVWLTDDERRMPVQMQAEVFIGHVTAELVRHTHPAAPEAVRVSLNSEATTTPVN